MVRVVCKNEGEFIGDLVRHRSRRGIGITGINNRNYS
jgi:hypothetical protein